MITRKSSTSVESFTISCSPFKRPYLGRSLLHLVGYILSIIRMSVYIFIHLYTILYIYGREWDITRLKANKIEKIDYRSTARRCVLPGRFKWRLNMFEHAQTPGQGQCFEISQTTNPKTLNPKTQNPKTPNPKT